MIDQAIITAGSLFNPTLQASTGYTFWSLLNMYIINSGGAAAAVAIPSVLAALVFAACFALPQREKVPSVRVESARNLGFALLFLLVVLIVASTAFPIAFSPLDALGNLIIFMLVVAVLGYCVLSATTLRAADSRGRVTSTTVVVLAVLLLAPLVSGVGTLNNLISQMVFSATLWATAAGCALALLWTRTSADRAAVLPRSAPLVLGVAVLAAAGLALQSEIRSHPYQTAPLFSQKTPVTADTSGLQDSRLTAEEAELADWLELSPCGWTRPACRRSLR